MLKIVAVGATALVITASPLAYAQSALQSASPGARLSADDLSKLTDMRIDVVRAALQLTPAQQNYWPAIENAIRARAKHRGARLVDFAGRAEQLRSNPGETLLNSDPVGLMRRRADALAQRASDLKQLADAWEPLYQTLDPQQKRRLAFLTISVLRRVRNGDVGNLLPQSDDDDQP
jgi:LTXXQ motif family protein